jgi:alpha-mannosidase
MRLSLLRSATAPDSHQDEGVHEFCFAVMPHRGHFLQSDVPRAAIGKYLSLRLLDTCVDAIIYAEFNTQTHVRYNKQSTLDGGTPAPQNKLTKHCPFSVSGALNVILDTVKRGEDDDFSSADAQKTVIVRLYEAYGGTCVSVFSCLEKKLNRFCSLCVSRTC